MAHNLLLFGEWCYAIHSVAYDRLPDWFLGFDVYDGAIGAFWDTARRDALLTELGLHQVPRLAAGHFTVPQLHNLLGASSVGHGQMEDLSDRQIAAFSDRR